MEDAHPAIDALMHAANDVGALAGEQGYGYWVGHPVFIAHLRQSSLQMAWSKLLLAGLVRAREPSSLFSFAPPDIAPPQSAAADAPRKPALMKPELVDVYRHRLQAFVQMSRAFGIQPVIMTEPFSG